MQTLWFKIAQKSLISMLLNFRTKNDTQNSKVNFWAEKFKGDFLYDFQTLCFGRLVLTLPRVGTNGEMVK